MRWLAPLALFVVACGPSPSDDDGGGKEGSGDDDSTGAPSCEIYDPDPDIGPAVTVTVRHEGTSPIYVIPTGCIGGLAFEIVDAGGGAVPYLLDECEPRTCDGFVASTDCSVSCPNCGAPNAARIDPGATGESGWSGARLIEMELSSACAPASECPATCLRPEQAPPGTYEIRLVGYRTCTGPCECDGGPPLGVCPLFGGEQLSDSIVFGNTIDYPTQTSVELVIVD
jgi:hypothetical protein